MQLLKYFSGPPIVPGTTKARKALVAGATKNLDTLDLAELKLNAVVVAATAAEINQSADDSDRYVAAGATLALTVAAHNKKIIKLDTAAGSVVTLPAATGSGALFRFVVSLLATSNSHIVKVNATPGTDTMAGIVEGTRVDSGNAVLGFAAGATADTITLNRTTTGSVSLGEWLELIDFATGLWHVRGVLSATGAAFATPFSATVP